MVDPEIAHNSSTLTHPLSQADSSTTLDRRTGSAIVPDAFILSVSSNRQPSPSAG